MKHLAIIPGDGIGKEVIAAGMEVLDAVSEISSFQYDPEFFDIGSDRYLATGELLTDEDVAAFSTSTSTSVRSPRGSRWSR